MQVMGDVPQSTTFGNLCNSVVNFHCELVHFLRFTSLYTSLSFNHIYLMIVLFLYWLYLFNFLPMSHCNPHCKTFHRNYQRKTIHFCMCGWQGNKLDFGKNQTSGFQSMYHNNCLRTTWKLELWKDITLRVVIFFFLPLPEWMYK